MDFIIITILSLLIPVVVFTGTANCFDTPKTLILMAGVAIMIIHSVHKLNAIPNIIKMLICCNIFSMFYTMNPYYTKVAIALNFLCFMVYFFTSQSLDDRKSVALLSAITVSGFIVGLVVWCQFFWYYPFKLDTTDIVGTIGNPNYLGCYLVFPFFASLGLMFLLNRIKYINLLFLVIIAGALIIARSRASWVGTIAGLIIFAVMIRLPIKKIAFCILSVLLIAGLLITYAPDKYKNRVAFSKSLDVISIKYRFTGYIPPAIELFKEHPIIGTGLWSYRNQVYEAQAKLYRKDKTFFDKYPDPKPRRAHNDYIEILVDGGILYFTLYSIFIGGVLYRGVRNYRREQSGSSKRIIFATSISCMVCVLVIAFFFFPLRVNSTLFMTCLMLGIIDA